jgi:hypothetical protein
VGYYHEVYTAFVTFTFFNGLLVLFTVANGYRMRVFIFGDDSNKSKFDPGSDEEIEFR